MRFIGDFSAKLDNKGRVFLPASLRKQLDDAGEGRLVLRPDVFQHCLVLYPESLWNALLDSLRARLNRWNGDEQRVFRRFVADAEYVELDSSGRFLISRKKLEYAGMRQDVRFLAVDDHIEVWDKDACEAELDDQDSLGKELEGLMAAF